MPDVAQAFFKEYVLNAGKMEDASAKELSKRQTGRTLYLLDEPTTGLHFDDVNKLLEVIHRLTDLGKMRCEFITRF